MTKFAAQSARDFRTAAANAGRVIRAQISAVCFVVIVEADDGSWCELDAESITHGERLAMNWVDTMCARGACVWAFDAANSTISKSGAMPYGKGLRDASRKGVLLQSVYLSRWPRLRLLCAAAARVEAAGTAQGSAR